MFKYSLFLLVASLFVTVTTGDPTFVSRAKWDAKRPKSQQALKKNPPPFVVIHHSAGNTCTTIDDCKGTVKGIQKYHMESRGWKDIGYNFLVGGDGLVYEGRGWGKYGAHAPKYNSKSIGICMIGNFETVSPSSVQFDALKDLLQYAVGNSYVTSDYKLLGHRQSGSTSCPGDKLYDEIETWLHFDPHPQ